jgi:hypothetical protein
MSNEEIKQECEKAYIEIKIYQERLNILRDICKHEKTEEGNYSWRPGAIHRADICVYCNTPVKFLDIPTFEQTTI